MAASRFGASKFRNAVPHVPPREEWYRGSLPASSSSTASATSTFSSEVKANRTLLVTVTPTGDITWRGVQATEDAAPKGQGKVGTGGSVGDWDLGRVEGGELVIGGADGSLSLFRLSPAETTLPAPLSRTPTTASPVTSVALHPSVPSLVLASSISQPAAIWDLSAESQSPVIQLEAKEPKGMWSIAWSWDGRLVAGIGKSGTCYVWDARASTQPTMTRSLPIQPLKPARVVWVGEDLFVTSTSKMRNREYHLFSTSKSLATVFTHSVDTNTAPLIPVVDQERRIVYLAGKGDMTLRQVELSGPQGYQETLHPIPHAVSAAGLALASPTTLPVMQAQIATVLIPVSDKDGDAILPLGIRVPRRQLIDFHDDLYPEVRGFIPEDNASSWLRGENKLPLTISLDPSRRQTWEAELNGRDNGHRATRGSDAASSSVEGQASQPEQDSKQDAEAEARQDKSVVTAPFPASIPPASIPGTEGSIAQSEGSQDLPPLEGSETRSSTSYKARIIAEHIQESLGRHRKKGSKEPMFAGLQGPQGCGKTTLCEGFIAFLREKMDIRAAVLSLDDLYHTNANLKAVAAQHPNNHLLSGRGPPGTHDTALAKSVLEAVRRINERAGAAVDLPTFDKSLCGGEGDRSEQVVKAAGPIDVFILEGWSMGFGPLNPDRLSERYGAAGSTTPKPYFAKHAKQDLVELNDYLSSFSAEVYPYFSTLITVVPTSNEHVFAWRLEQEHAMKAKNGGKGMTDEQVRSFVERYMPGYELWREGMWDREWSGLELTYGRDREVLKVERREGKQLEAAAGDIISSPVPKSPLRAPQQSQEPRSNGAAMGTSSAPEAANASTPAKPAIPAPQTVRAPASTSLPTTTPSTTSSTSDRPHNPAYSRKFLAAKAPLIPAYDSLPSLSTLHPDSLILKVSKQLAFFPVQGPGGRLGVHPLAKKGRMAVGGQGYLSGGVEITDFAVEPFVNDDGKTAVAVAGEDGAIRAWNISKEGVDGLGPESEMTLRGRDLDKIVQIAFSPVAKGILFVATNDHVTSAIRFFDLSAREEVKGLQLPAELKGIFSFAVNPAGNRFAVATKSGQVAVLDRDTQAQTAAGKAHDSPRSFQLAWITPSHLVSVGFNKGSQRRINLYEIKPAGIETTHSLLIDVSPSVLFPVYDPDTHILYVWGKGERNISAYEINIDSATEPLTKLPTYTAGEAQVGIAFKSKLELDVKKVEVMKVLRLTGKTIEEVTFSIPRNKPEFFQDDIYVDTVDTQTPVLTAREWLDGKKASPRYNSLKPDNMTPLSQAPKTVSTKPKFVPAKDVMTEAQKKQQEMDALFNKAKADESSDEEVPQKGLAPPDDDW